MIIQFLVCYMFVLKCMVLCNYLACCVSLVLFVFLLLSYLPNGLSYRCGLECCDMHVCVHICVCICVYIAQPTAERIEDPGQSVNAPSEDTPPPTSDPTPLPTSPPSQAQCPELDSDPGPPLVTLSPPEEPGTGQAKLEQGMEGSVWKVAAKVEAAVYVPLAAMTLESMLDPTELSTVSAERHMPGSGLPPKQSQSQKPPGEAGLPPPSSFLSASICMCVLTGVNYYHCE